MEKSAAKKYAPMIICWVFFLCQKLLALAANKKSSFLNFKSFDKKKDFFLHKNKEKTQKKLLMISGAKRERLLEFQDRANSHFFEERTNMKVLFFQIDTPKIFFFETAIHPKTFLIQGFPAKTSNKLVQSLSFGIF